MMKEAVVPFSSKERRILCLRTKMKSSQGQPWGVGWGGMGWGVRSGEKERNVMKGLNEIAWRYHVAADDVILIDRDKSNSIHFHPESRANYTLLGSWSSLWAVASIWICGLSVTEWRLLLALYLMCMNTTTDELGEIRIFSRSSLVGCLCIRAAMFVTIIITHTRLYRYHATTLGITCF